MSQEVDPAEVMRFPNLLYSRYDQLLDVYNVYKVRAPSHIPADQGHDARPILLGPSLLTKDMMRGPSS